MSEAAEPVESRYFKELLATKLRAAQAAQSDACNVARRCASLPTLGSHAFAKAVVQFLRDTDADVQRVLALIAKSTLDGVRAAARRLEGSFSHFGGIEAAVEAKHIQTSIDAKVLAAAASLAEGAPRTASSVNSAALSILAYIKYPRRVE